MILASPLIPKNKDGILRVLLPGRVSTLQQDPKSIDSQYLDDENWLRLNYRGPLDIRHFGEQASGWLADRATMQQVERIILDGGCDAVVASELREIYRNPAFHWRFAQMCVDNDVRFISIADNIDTAQEDWETHMHVASLRAGLAVPEIRRRVRRKATYSFQQGGMVLKVRFGYTKLTVEEAASGRFGTPGLRIAKQVEWTPVIKEMKARLQRLDSYEQIADWLEEESVPPGPYVVGRRWSGRLVRDLLEDPILSGRRRFRANLHTLIFNTGKHRSRKNPTGPETKEYPELAHLTVAEHDEILPIILARRQEAAAGQLKGRDNPRYNRPRSRSIWPGQHARCICGGLMYRLGEFLRCENSIPQGPGTCWNHVQVEYEYVYANVIPWVISLLDKHPQARNHLVQMAWKEFEQATRRRHLSGDSLEKRIGDLQKQATALAKAIAHGGQMESLVEELGKIDKALQEARQQQSQLGKEDTFGKGYRSADDIAARLDEALLHMAKTSFDFADILRKLIPVFIIQPVQAFDRPQVRPRAKLTLSLAAWTTSDEPVFEVSTVLDLFKAPEHITHLCACVEAKKRDPTMTLKQIATKLGINHMTVKRALDYARRMEREGLSDPYREIHEKPLLASRWGKRQANPDVDSVG